jgi:sugar/nucleoside kinase (ribokinase family)
LWPAFLILTTSLKFPPEIQLIMPDYSSSDSNSADVVCAGVIVADHLCPPLSHMPHAGELVAVDRLILAIGGCAANAAINLARLGLRTRVSGKVGPDMFGKFVVEVLEKEGLDASGMIVDPGNDTSQTLIINIANQDRRFIHTFGANRTLSVDDLRASIDDRKPPKVFYLGGYLILPGLDPAELAEFFAWLGSLGVHRVLDVATPGPGDYLPQLRPVLPHVDAFLPNEDEAALILGPGTPLEHARAFQKMGTKLAVITCGGHGAIVASRNECIELGVYDVPFVDGTGGGDAFDAGYIAGVVEGGDIQSCLTRAAAQGASCVQGIGTTATIFNKAKSDEFIRQNPLSLRIIQE